MLAKIAPPGRDFKALCDYLMRGRGSPVEERVSWTMARNLPTDDAELAAKLMAATARLSARTLKPVYHVMIAWAPQEQPDAEMMQTIATQALELTGLGEHQAYIVSHGDTAHRHLHMVINRVHPETGKAWRAAHDFKLFDRVMRQLAGAHGFTHVPAHLFNPEETKASMKLPHSAARRAGDRGADTLRPQWSRRDAEQIGRRVSEDLDQASSQDDVNAAFERLGLHVEQKGRGHVVGNDTGYVKASALELAWDARLLRLRAGGAMQLVDGVDIARALRTWGLADDDDVQAAIEDARLARRRRNSSELAKE